MIPDLSHRDCSKTRCDWCFKGIRVHQNNFSVVFMRIDTLLYSCSACYKVSHSIQIVSVRYIRSQRHSEFFIDISYRVNVYMAGVETSGIY